MPARHTEALDSPGVDHTTGSTQRRVESAPMFGIDLRPLPGGMGLHHTPHGRDLLHPRSRACVGTAVVLYSEILDRIEAMDFDIFNQRATVGNGRRLQVASIGLLRAWRARIAHPAKV